MIIHNGLPQFFKAVCAALEDDEKAADEARAALVVSNEKRREDWGTSTQEWEIARTMVKAEHEDGISNTN
jgi:hypothetical protein